LEASWRQNLLRLVAVDDNHDNYSIAVEDSLPHVSIGTPFSEHWSRRLPTLPTLALSYSVCVILFLLLCAPFYELTRLMRMRPLALRPILALLGFALASFLFFFLCFWKVNIAAIGFFAWLICGTSVVLTQLIRGRR